MPTNGFQVSLHAPEPEQAHAGGQVREQVHVAVRAVFAAGHAAEHAQARHAMGGRCRDYVMPVPAHPLADGTRKPIQPPRLPAHLRNQLIAGRLDQRGQSRQGGLPVPGLISQSLLRKTPIA